MDKEIYFYESAQACGHDVLISWDETEHAIDHFEPCIRTTQMGILTLFSRLLLRKYRIFIVEYDGECYEIKLGGGNTRTNRVIHPAHNIFKLWASGEFSRR